jgi:hypothetical protein
MARRIHNDYVEHVVMYRQVGWDFQTQAVCTCGWEGTPYQRFTDADDEGNIHLKRYERFPSQATQD